MSQRAKLLIGVGALVAIAVVAVIVAASVGGGSTNPTVAIVQPASGAKVPSGQPVTVEAKVEGAELAASMDDTSAGHLHVYIDGKIASMPITTTSTVVLKPGPHQIEVEFVDPNHTSLDPPVIASVEVTAKK
jgi:hypothetical protein